MKHSSSALAIESLSELLPSASKIERVEQLSRLWAGYGYIYRIHLRDESGAIKTKILKVISPPQPRNPNDEGHLRKLLSYRIEKNFYQHFSHKLRCHVPSSEPLSDQNKDHNTVVLLLEDLTIEYSILTGTRGVLDDVQVSLAITWLARFHASFWNIEHRVESRTWCPPPLQAAQSSWSGTGLWQQGGYSYLATRMDELRGTDSPWAELGLNADGPLAFAVDWCLNHPSDRTRLGLIHGDEKAANMAFGEGKMAMYDFQYVGKGLGVQDLAKFFTTSISEEYLDDEEGLLRRYHHELTKDLREVDEDAVYPFEDLLSDWELALVSWVRFLAGWSGGFWGNTEWLTTRVEGLLRDETWTGKVIERWRQGGGQDP